MTEKKEPNSMAKETLFARFALIGGVVLMLILPLLLTQDWSSISFLDTGPIGDTIGGITAPISGLLGAYLVFLALKAQVNANQYVQDQILMERESDRLRKEYQYQMDLCNFIESRILEFECDDTTQLLKHERIKGYVALDYLLERLGNPRGTYFQVGSEKHRFIHSILTLMENILDSFESRENDESDIRFPLVKLDGIFYDKIWEQIKRKTIDPEVFDSIFKEEDRIILTRFKNVERRINHLGQAEDVRRQGQPIFRS